VISRFRRFWQSVPARIAGSHVDVGAEQVTYLSSKAPMPSDTKLEQRLKEANRQPLPKAERKTPESDFLRQLRAAAQSDLVGPLDYDASPPPV
jgi:hypothetical protein